jgi:uncharacterized protein involved in exopolysaccharide biosynthesis
MSDAPPPDPVAIVLARLEVKLDNALATQSDQGGRLKSLEEQQAAHSTEIAVLQAASLPSRIAALEKKLWMAAGAAAAAGGGAGAIVSRIFGA